MFDIHNDNIGAGTVVDISTRAERGTFLGLFTLGGMVIVHFSSMKRLTQHMIDWSLLGTCARRRLSG